jgi:Tfp pilus assembly protein PilN
VRAVNLIPGDARPNSGVKVSGGLGPGYAVIALLGVAVLLVSVYVLTSNTISDRHSKLATLQTQVSQEQAQASRLANFASFLKLTQARIETVRQIASSRFDWHAALADLSKVIPANTSLQSLTGTVAPGATVSGAGGSAGGSSLRGAIASPAFEMQGCTKTQDDVARVMSRLRLVNGVQRVTLASSLKQDGGQTGAGVASGTGAAVGCGANAPTFDLVIFFAPLPGASVATTPGGSTAATATAAASTAASGTTTPAAATTTPAATIPASKPTGTVATSPGAAPQISNTAPAQGSAK